MDVGYHIPAVPVPYNIYTISNGGCDRCRAVLITCPSQGNAQPRHVFDFDGADSMKYDGRILFHGMLPECFHWTAKLCDQCLHDLRFRWLKGLQ